MELLSSFLCPTQNMEYMFLGPVVSSLSVLTQGKKKLRSQQRKKMKSQDQPGGPGELLHIVLENRTWTDKL